MEYLVVTSLLLLTILVRPSQQQVKLYTTEGLLARQGYRGEEHKVTTEDGYVLRLYRVLPSDERQRNTTGIPVLVVHGFLGSSQVWLFRDRRQNLPTIMADNGYDVWLANRRGNTFSHGHKTLTTEPDNFNYWNFSFHESGLYDQSAQIDYILSQTGRRQLVYIGHSMGNTELLVLTSLRPEYNQKIQLAVMLAPVASPRLTQPPPMLALIVRQAQSIVRYLFNRQNYAFMQQDENLMRYIQERCSPKREQKLCMTLLQMLFFANVNNWEKEEFAYIASHFTFGSSVKTFSHLAQLLTQGSKFKRFDYGTFGNLEVYGRKEPPAYDLGRVSLPIALIYSEKDAFIDDKTIADLKGRLSNVIFDQKITDPTFRHMDYMYSSKSRYLVTGEILKLLSNMTANSTT